MAGQPPPAVVLEAFGAAGSAPVPLEGGEGRSWRAGDLVLKPVDDDASAAWAADLLSRIREDGFRVARPVGGRDGSWVVAGWTASRWVDGRHEPRWADVIAAGEAFHRAVRHEPRPAFLDLRDDPWAVGDRVAWEERPVDPFLEQVPELARLAASRRPFAAGDAQLIHGDLSENVLFAAGLAPAIIDLSPYWRPTGFASAIVIADALLWRDAGPDILDVAPNLGDLGQHLIRGLIYRLVTHSIFHPEDPGPPTAGSATDMACRT